MMWADYAKKLGVGVQSLTKAQKIQAEVNGILEESKYQVGDAAKVSETYAGQVATLSFQFQQFKVALGEAIIPVAKAVIPGIRSIISALAQLANAFAQVTTLMFGGEIKNPAKDEMEDQKEIEDGLTESGKDAAGATGELAGATEGMGEASKEAAKEMKGVVAGFDGLNKLAGQTADNMGDASGELGGLDVGDFTGGGELFGGVTVNPEIVAFVDNLKKQLQELADILGRIWDVFQDAWDKNGAKVIEAAKSALLSIWELLKAIAKTFADVFASGAGERFLENIMTIIAGILNFIATLADQFKDVWDRMGEDLVIALFYALNSVLELVISIGSAFVEAWNSGVGVEILETIMSILTGIFNLIGIIANKIQEAWEANGNGVAIWTSILNIISDVLGFIDRLVAATVSWASELDLEPIVSSFRTLLETVEPLVEHVLDALGWSYENILLPLSKWVIEKAAPAGIDLLSAAIEALTEVSKALEPIRRAFVSEFLAPLAVWTGEVFIFAIKAITEALTAFSSWAMENQEFIQAMTISVGALFAVFATQQLVQIIPTIVAAINVFILKLISLESITSLLNLKVLGLSIALTAITLGISSLIGVWDSMTGWEKYVTIFGVLATAVTAAAIAFGVFHATASMGLAAVGIAAGIAMVVASIVAANNAAKRATPSKYSVPNMKSNFEQSIPYFTPYGMPPAPSAATYTIPKLAKGAVIPPNQQFMAILGDQRSGTNIESPLSTIEQALRNVMAEQGGAGQEIVIQNHMNMDGREVFSNQQRIGKLMGRSLVTIGG